MSGDKTELSRKKDARWCYLAIGLSILISVVLFSFFAGYNATQLAAGPALRLTTGNEDFIAGNGCSCFNCLPQTSVCSFCVEISDNVTSCVPDF